MGTPYRRHSGFSLLETVIVLGIGSILAIALLRSYSDSQRQSRFTDAIETVVTTLEKTRQEANSVYTTGLGTNPNRIFFAKVVAFDNTSSTYRINTLTVPRSEALSTPIEQVATQTQTIPWGIYCVCSDLNRYVHFVRMPDSTQLRVYLENGVSQQVNDYSSTAATSNLCFASTEGLRALVSINSNTGEITRRYVASC